MAITRQREREKEDEAETVFAWIRVVGWTPPAAEGGGIGEATGWAAAVVES
jgi:hypothetical protein